MQLKKFLPDNNFSMSKQSYVNGPVKCLLTTCDVCSLFYMGERMCVQYVCVDVQKPFTEGFLTSWRDAFGFVYVF